MTITEAQQIINARQADGTLSLERAAWYAKMARRKGDYGHLWSYARQAQMRDNLLKDL